MSINQYRVTFLASIQWMFFIFANVVVVPISVGAVFDLPPYEIVTILRSSLIVTGIACILQGVVGHRYPLLEGHSGMMWALILNLAAAAPTLGLSLQDVGGGIATGMLIAGSLIIVFSVTGIINVIQKVFSPMIMTVFLMLLTFQLAFIFFKGMLKVNDDGTIHIAITLFSFAIALLVAILKVKGKPMISNFSLLIGMMVGWMIYTIIFSTDSLFISSSEAKGSFTFFPLGKPNLQYSIIIVTFIACLINMSNTFASIRAASSMYNDTVQKGQYRNSMFLTGVYSVVASFCGLVAFAPFASSIGFLESSQILDKKPFLIGGGLIILLGIIPSMGLLLATIPVTVGNAVLFVAYLQLLGTTIKNIKQFTFDSRSIHRIAAPVLIGVSVMSLDQQIFSSLPSLIQPLCSNGFIVGVILSLIFENTINWKNT